MPEIKLKHGAWVVVADGEKALFLKNEGDALHPNLEVVREMHDDNPPTRAQGTDRPGRYADASTSHKSAFTETDWHRLEKEHFADQIAERLYRMAHRGDFDDLIVVAPPQVLGEMRKKMHKEVTDRISAEIPKTLTKQPVWDIETLLTSES